VPESADVTTRTKAVSARGWRIAKRCGRPWGKAGRCEPGLGTGRGGDVTGPQTLYSSDVTMMTPLSLSSQRDGDDAVAIVGRGSPSETQRFGSDCDCRFTKW